MKDKEFNNNSSPDTDISTNKKYKYEMDKRLFGKEFAQSLKPFGKKALSIKSTYIHLITFSKDKAAKKNDHWFFILEKDLCKYIPVNKKTLGINLSILRKLGLVYMKKNPTDIDIQKEEGLEFLIDSMLFRKPNTIFLKVFPLSDEAMKNVKDRAIDVSRWHKEKTKTSERMKVKRMEKRALDNGMITEEQINKNRDENNKAMITA